MTGIGLGFSAERTGVKQLTDIRLRGIIEVLFFFVLFVVSFMFYVLVFSKLLNS